MEKGAPNIDNQRPRRYTAVEVSTDQKRFSISVELVRTPEASHRHLIMLDAPDVMCLSASAISTVRISKGATADAVPRDSGGAAVRMAVRQLKAAVFRDRGTGM